MNRRTGDAAESKAAAWLTDRGLTVIEPLGPRRFRYRGYGFVPREVRFGWIGRRIQDLSMRVFLRMGRKIIGEDAVLWPQVQDGVEASDHRGVLSAREERVYAFQRFVAERLRGMSLEPSAK